MGVVAALAGQMLREQSRRRAYLLILLFGGALLYSSILVGVLAVDQELRVLMDLGLALIELTVLAAAVHGAATSVLEDMESKTVYLILTRPLGKWQYLLGRFFGLVGTAVLAGGAMGVLHLGLLWAKGWAWQGAYGAALLGGLLKVVVISSLATFFALFSTSVVSAICMTGFLWLLGHFLPEVTFLLSRDASPGASVVKATLYLVPNLQLFNLRDRLEVPGASLGALDLLVPMGYAATYVGVALSLALWLFSRKEF